VLFQLPLEHVLGELAGAVRQSARGMGFYEV